MAGSFTNVQRDHIMDIIFRGGPVTRTLASINGDLKLALTTTLPTAAVAGTEVTGGGYARVILDTSNLSGVTAGVIKNIIPITFTNMPAATVQAIEVWDNTNIRLLWQRLVDPIVVASGQNLVFAPNALTFSLVSV